MAYEQIDHGHTLRVTLGQPLPTRSGGRVRYSVAFDAFQNLITLAADPPPRCLVCGSWAGVAPDLPRGVADAQGTFPPGPIGGESLALQELTWMTGWADADTSQAQARGELLTLRVILAPLAEPGGVG
jgi:hypothetical protein